MLKSPEEYLSSLDFDPGDSPANQIQLNASERAFVEKYLGRALLKDLPEVDPEPIPLLQAEEPAWTSAPALAPAPQIVVAPPLSLEVAPLEVQVALPQVLDAPQIVISASEDPILPRTSAAETATLQVNSLPDTNVVQTGSQIEIAEEIATEAAVETEVATEVVAETAVEVAQATDLATIEEIATETAVETKVVAEIAVESEVAETTRQDTISEVATVAEVASKSVVSTDGVSADIIQTAQAVVAPVLQPPAVKPEVLLREKLRLQAEVQLVSFFVCGQLFLLPVEGIQEVLRHQELIKVPQAPDFVAGVINLRGRVTPVVHLSALLTNNGVTPYDEKNFIIIAGTDNLQLGLIIDKVCSMHMVPQKQFIWNPETKLAEAAEFLNAIVTLEDRVCGMVAPETITRLILPDS